SRLGTPGAGCIPSTPEAGASGAAAAIRTAIATMSMAPRFARHAHKMQAAPCPSSIDLGRLDGLLQLAPGALDAGLQRLPAILAGHLQLLQLAARLLLLLVGLHLRQLVLVLDAALRGGLLRLRLHLLELRAPLRHLSLHPGDIGVLH